MNKMMLIPIAFLLVLLLFAVSYTGEEYDSSPTEDYSNSSIVINGTDASVEVPEAGSYTFDMWTTAGSLVILTAAVAAGILAGISILGSGLSETSQNLIFNSILFGGLWACLSAVVADFMFATTGTTLLWTVLTVVYVIGIGAHMSNGDG